MMMNDLELDNYLSTVDRRLAALEEPDRSENRCFEPFMANGVITPCNNTLGWHNRPDVHHPFNESIGDAISAMNGRSGVFSDRCDETDGGIHRGMVGEKRCFCGSYKL